ncbi:DUF4352 domain-containing protein [Rhodococcus sp. CSLK01-03]|uniref:DUF4352 domain-containing protein n=1 Tax=Rhodococcus indonesiensis TaxID=3055869 RepID=A0ABT7RHD3_9NOCA|nr:DUF4352 domain-containing protein [Rhodococcus indonesiensis]MDM7487050.1 DUF4352 domain-containing protein [Rhodococcus indonesiensis]
MNQNDPRIQPPQGFPAGQYPGWQNSAVQPQPPQKKRKKWPWVVGAVVALFAIAGVSGGDEEDSSTATAPSAGQTREDRESAPARPTQTDQPAAGLDTPVRDGKFEFVVTEVQTGLTTLGDNQFLAEDAQGQFVIVTMTVSNISDQPKGLSPSDQKLIDSQGRTFSPDTSAALNLETDVAFWDEINPGNTVTMPVVFDMPVDAVPASIELHDSMFSGGVTVSLR